jgi:putative flippase GtrA
VEDQRRWTPRQLRTFALVMVGGVALAVAVTAVLSAVTDLGAPRATFAGVLVAVIAMYAAIITLGIRERRERP